MTVLSAKVSMLVHRQCTGDSLPLLSCGACCVVLHLTNGHPYTTREKQRPTGLMGTHAAYSNIGAKGLTCRLRLSKHPETRGLSWRDRSCLHPHFCQLR